MNRPAAVFSPEQYDFSMNANYIPAECGFQLQHTVIANAENRQHYLLLCISTTVCICRVSQAGGRFCNWFWTWWAPCSSHKVKRGSIPVVVESLRALWHGALARWTLDYAHGAWGKGSPALLKGALRAKSRRSHPCRQLRITNSLGSPRLGMQEDPVAASIIFAPAISAARCETVILRLGAFLGSSERLGKHQTYMSKRAPPGTERIFCTVVLSTFSEINYLLKCFIERNPIN